MSLTSVIGGTYIGWLALIPNPIINTNEAWFLTNTEKVHQLFCKLVEVIDTVNSQTELFKKLAYILDEFDDSVKEAVEEYIKKMYEDGTLKDLIEEVVVKYMEEEVKLPKFSSHLNLQKMFQHLCSYGNVDGTTPTNSGHLVCQGSVAFKTSNTSTSTHYVMALSKPSEEQSNEIKLIEWTANDNPFEGVTYPTKVRDSATSELHLGHCNGLCYNPTKQIYLAVHYYEYMNGVATGVNYVSIVKPTDSGFILEETLTTPRRYITGTYSNTDECFYMLAEDNKIYKYDYENNTDEYVCKLSLNCMIPVGTTSANYISSYATIGHKGNYFYIGIGDNAKHSLNPANQIHIFDMKGNLVFSYEMEKQYSGYVFGEMESISFDKFGNSYIFTTNQLYSGSDKFIRINQCFKVDFEHNTNTELVVDNERYPSSLPHIYVKFYNTTVNPHINYNPTGNYDNPFNYVQDAINYINNNPKITCGEIRIINQTATTSPYPLMFIGSKPITVRWGELNYREGSYHYDASNTASDNNYIGNIAIYNSPTVTIRSGYIQSKIRCNNFDNWKTGSPKKTDSGEELTVDSTVQIRNSNVHLQSCHIDTPSTSRADIQYKVMNQNSFLIIDSTSGVKNNGSSKSFTPDGD